MPSDRSRPTWSSNCSSTAHSRQLNYSYPLYQDACCHSTNLTWSEVPQYSTPPAMVSTRQARLQVASRRDGIILKRFHADGMRRSLSHLAHAIKPTPVLPQDHMAGAVANISRPYTSSEVEYFRRSNRRYLDAAQRRGIPLASDDILEVIQTRREPPARFAPCSASVPAFRAPGSRGSVATTSHRRS